MTKDVRCPYHSRAYGGQCELRRGHEGRCVTQGDGFVGGWIPGQEEEKAETKTEHVIDTTTDDRQRSQDDEQAAWCSICGHPWWGIGVRGNGNVGYLVLEEQIIPPGLLELMRWNFCGSCLKKVNERVHELMQQLYEEHFAE